MTSYITLHEAHEQHRRDTGLANAYDWHRKHAQNYHKVWMYDRDIPVQKINRQWVISQADFDQAATAHRDRVIQAHQNTLDYENHILHKPGAQTDWGSYAVSEHFHTCNNPQAAAYDAYKHRGFYRDAKICNTCFEPVTEEYGPFEPCTCHVCEDWGGCGSGGTKPLLSVNCTNCGWKIEY